jgi:hypothetical protein
MLNMVDHLLQQRDDMPIVYSIKDLAPVLAHLHQP